VFTSRHTTLSAYLVKPDLSARTKQPWKGFKTKLVSIKRSNPRLGSRAAIGLLLWGVLGWSVQYVAAARQSPEAAAPTASHASLTTLATPLKPNATLAAARPAGVLPGGPTGDLLPPGTLAPDRQYANHYSWCQCTWYVAGRRQIPNGWGNARQWYYNATASGWHVGPTPAVGAVAWTPAGYYGHVALVEQVSAGGGSVYISEMNYRGVGVKSFRWAAASAFKYIY
jgi:hypothetical protein